MTGEAGSGKSSKLAFVWAKGEGLLLVYVLLVRDLLGSCYHGQDDSCHAATLATAVISYCFSQAGGEKPKFM